ncbi:sulfur reduction protein DsrJ [Candidatus Venteria ishoeyi]|nr:sulfur reduction protein DsrJ [Candidatus Venteria ishoeyi]MDM8547560.1 hypothetical protein [Candidatus Venteria ishoeyi]
MKQKRLTLSLLSMVCMLLLSSWTHVYGDTGAKAPKAIAWASETQACVESNEFMRRNHMELIRHQRDDTMRKGIRTTKHSLQQCINCHVTYDDNKQPVAQKDPRHFCSACHNYAAVNIDCFQCHNSKPTDDFVKPIAGHADFVHPLPLDKISQDKKSEGDAQ